MFSVSLDELFNRDKTPVPMVVIQCIQAVDIYGLDTEGIYRVAGSQSHVNSLRNVFDNGNPPSTTVHLCSLLVLILRRSIQG